MRVWLVFLGLIAGLFCFIADEGEAAGYNYLDSCGPTWALPVPYWLNEEGTRRIPDFGAMEMAIHASFASWGEPCCSGVRARYEGKTAETALNTQKEVVLSFSDDRWPAAFGGPYVIAITIPTISAACEMKRAPILFNTFHHRYDLEGEEVDLQVVATHEVGHLLGLDHTENIGGVMFPHYTGGTRQRRLADVDVEGICSLYPVECNCRGAEDCRVGEICEDGMCKRAPCGSDAECGLGRICMSDGACVLPPCEGDGDCEAGLVCENKRCLSACAACRVCERHADCGAHGYCYPFEDGPRCMIVCGIGGRCPGDSVCQRIGEGEEEASYCMSPDAEGHEYCPGEYICEGGGGADEACPGLGEDCRPGSYECTVANDRCLERADGSYICSCSCLTDADCGERSRCIMVEGGRACIPERQDPCEGVVCRSFEECYDGRCVDPMPEVGRVEREGLSGCVSVGGGSGSGVWWLLILVTSFGLGRRRSRFGGEGG